MLNDTEELGIKLLAMARTGQLKMFSCGQCSIELQKIRNCNGDDVDKPVWFHPDLGQFTCCPIRLITEDIIKWVDQYDYYTKFPNAYQVPYEEMNAKWWEAVKMYDRTIQDFELKEHERQMAQLKNKK